MAKKSFFNKQSCLKYVKFFYLFSLLVCSFFIINGIQFVSATTSPLSNSSQNVLNTSFTQSSSANSSLVTLLSLHLDFSTFFANSSVTGVATDNAGNLYITGSTTGGLFVKNAFQSTYGGNGDVFVAKFTSTGSLIFCTYLGGSLQDSSSSIAVDNAGNVFITGTTVSSNFPLKNAFDKVYSTGYPDAFVAKFNTTGGLIFSTYLGGINNDTANGIAVDSAGNCYVTGPTSSSNFPTKHAYQSTFAGGNSDIFISKFAPNGSLLYSSFFGGSNDDFSYSIAVDQADNSYSITGTTMSSNFPTKNASEPSFNSAPSNNLEAFVSKFNSNNQLVFSTFLGGSEMDAGNAITVASNGIIYVTGNTWSSNFPLKNAFNITFDNSTSPTFTFLSEFSPSGNLVFSSYLDPGNPEAIVLDSSGNCFITGTTGAGIYPTENTTNVAFNQGNDVMLSEISSSNKLLYSSYFGGQYYDSGSGIAVDSTDDIIISGVTSSSDFPGYNGTTGGFLSKFTLLPVLTTPPSTGPFSLTNPYPGFPSTINGTTNAVFGPGYSVSSRGAVPGFSFFSLIVVLILFPFYRKKYRSKDK